MSVKTKILDNLARLREESRAVPVTVFGVISHWDRLDLSDKHFNKAIELVRGVDDLALFEKPVDVSTYINFQLHTLTIRWSAAPGLNGIPYDAPSSWVELEIHRGLLDVNRDRVTVGRVVAPPPCMMWETLIHFDPDSETLRAALADFYPWRWVGHQK